MAPRKMMIRAGAHTRALFEAEELLAAGWTVEELREGGLEV